MLYCRDCRLPTEAALSPPIDRDLIASDDYKTLAVARMTEKLGSLPKTGLRYPRSDKRLCMTGVHGHPHLRQEIECLCTG